MKNLTKIRTWILLVVFMVSLGSIQSMAQTVGEMGPDFEVNTLGGGKFKLSDQKGKVVFVFLFGNTCPSCRAIGPTVETSIYQAYASNPDFVAIGLDTWDSSSGESSVSGFKSSTGITFPLALKAGSVASAYTTTYDRFMVIDQDGILVHKGGTAASNDVNNVKAVIEQSLLASGISGLTASEAGVKVYPMPVREEVHFQSEQSIRQVRIYDTAGSLVYSDLENQGHSGGTRSLNLGTLEGGVYFYQLEREDGFVNGKLLIQR